MKSKIVGDFWPNPGKFNATILRHLSAAKGLGREARFLRRFAGATGLCPFICSGGQVRLPMPVPSRTRRLSCGIVRTCWPYCADFTAGDRGNCPFCSRRRHQNIRASLNSGLEKSTHRLPQLVSGVILGIALALLGRRRSPSTAKRESN